MAMKACLAAINDYSTLNGDTSQNLPSCIADARAFGKFLKQFGFTDIRYLLDADATKARVEESLDWLFTGVTEQDRLVFFYSGHGYTSYMDGNMEEYLVLSDGLWQDNLLSARTKRLPHSVLTVILDSCFSGGMLKILADPTGAGADVEVARAKVWTGPALEGAEKVITPAEQSVLRLKRFGLTPVLSSESIAKGLRPEAFPFPVENPFITRAAEVASKTFELPELTMPTNGVSKAGGVEDEPNQLEMKGLLLSACLPDETAAASTSHTKGLSAFTYALLESYPTVGGRKPANEVLKATAAHLQRTRFRQTPLILETPMPGNLKYRSFITLDLSPTKTVADAKFWGAFAAVLPSLVSAVAPTILNAITGQTKGLSEDLPDLSDPETAKGFWRRVGRALRSVIRTVAPVVISAVTGQRTKSTDTVLGGVDNIEPIGQEKFWGALATILPQLVSTVAPVIINALSGQGKSVDWTMPDESEAASPEEEKAVLDFAMRYYTTCWPALRPVISDAMLGQTKGFSTAVDSEEPVADEKFFGALAAVLPSLIQVAAPIIINAISGAQQKEAAGAQFSDGNGMASSPAQAMLDTSTVATPETEKFWEALAPELPSIMNAIAPIVAGLMSGQQKGFDPVEGMEGIQGVPGGEDKDFWGVIASIARPLISTVAPIVIDAITSQQRERETGVKAWSVKTKVPSEFVQEAELALGGYAPGVA